MDYKMLSQQFKRFTYTAYEYSVKDEEIELIYSYQLESDTQKIPFTHRVSYYVETNDVHLRKNQIQNYINFIFHIGLIETINYYKLACPKEIYIACGQLTKEQERWWKKLFYHGLGEFIYLNKMTEYVTEDNFVQFVSAMDQPLMNQQIHVNTQGSLIPVGGGKDSVVTLEILNDEHAINLPFVMSAPKAAYDCIEVAHYHEYLEAQRYFDPRLIEMNQQGYLNGHVPFSAILAFIAAFGALLSEKKYIPLSNERSANEPSVIGTTFNHQYSKSFEFEEDFATYLNQYLTQDIEYFSLLRPLYELEIGQLFSKYTQYHSVYRSCNRGKKENKWCGLCAKCLFVYIILSPYIPIERLEHDFGKELFSDMDLKDIFDELIGIKETKPFECVGTIWEVRHALNLFIQKMKHLQKAYPPLIQYYIDIEGPALSDQPTDYEEGNRVPLHYLNRLRKELENSGE
ncbi:hypothetical protein QBE53_11680 [Vallitaleaceae bacterium 9-2]